MKECLTLLVVLGVVAAMGTLSGCQKSSAPPAGSSTAPASTAPSAPTAMPPMGQNPGTASEKALAPPEKPIEPEKNPPGDIPDTQVFVTYKSTKGMYSIQAPEGWARTESGSDVKYVDKFDAEQVVVTGATTAPTVMSVNQELVPALEKAGRAVKVKNVTSKKMPSGLTAICVVYTSNSAPDPVTNKQVRLDNVTYYYYMTGMLAALTLWAPEGADNVDQWKLISESFKWK